MMKKRKFGAGGMPSIGDSVASGNRMAKQEGAEMRKMGVGAKPKPKATPSELAAAKSAERVGKQEGAEMRKMKMAKGGKASCYAKGGKVKKRYDDGGGVGEMGRAALDLEAKARTGETLRELDRMDTSVPKVSAPAKKQSFSAAFAAARKRGDKTFNWNGGSYGTKLKGEDDKPTRAASPAPTKAASPAPTRAASPAPTKAAAAKSEPRVGLSNSPRLAAFLNAITTGPKPGEGRPTKAQEAAREAKRREVNKDYTNYAKGGSVSKRADGIATKGKTKGRFI